MKRSALIAALLALALTACQKHEEAPAAAVEPAPAAAPAPAPAAVSAPAAEAASAPAAAPAGEAMKAAEPAKK